MLSPQGSAMREYQPVSPPHLSAIERPRCPACDHQRMLLSKIEANPLASTAEHLSARSAVVFRRRRYRRTQCNPAFASGLAANSSRPNKA